MANRIQRFIEGPDPGPRQRSSRISDVGLADFDHDDEETDVLSALLSIGREDAPLDMVKRMIAKLGQRDAVTALVDRLRTSPLGAMPEKMLRDLAKGIVDSVIVASGRPAHD